MKKTFFIIGLTMAVAFALGTATVQSQSGSGGNTDNMGNNMGQTGVGIVTVLSTSSIDMVARSSEDNKDQHAQQEDTGKMHAKAENTEDASSSSQAAGAARQD